MLATYLRRMRNNNLEIRIAGSSCRPPSIIIVIIIIIIDLFYWKKKQLVQPVLR